ncbi:hypothetical protein OS493_026165 [Desmophyllum pertusum]|uniref:Uncharacterized protein n=1 Tax=Desmophyllum pertusum TaxID=174260 RepID=A0A9W9ZZD7_9CNID|nr:hypothetical protein OS493_026165 [Desmophyllum pertusum]
MVATVDLEETERLWTGLIGVVRSMMHVTIGSSVTSSVIMIGMFTWKCTPEKNAPDVPPIQRMMPASLPSANVTALQPGASQVTGSIQSIKIIENANVVNKQDSSLSLQHHVDFHVSQKVN